MHQCSHLDFLRKENPWLASESSSFAASPSFFFRLNMRLNMLFGGFGGLPAALQCMPGSARAQQSIGLQCSAAGAAAACSWTESRQVQ